MSVALNLEIAGSICEFANGTIITTLPSIGGPAGSIPSACPADTNRVGTFHTHGAFDPAYDSENFSHADRRNASNRSLDTGNWVPNFVATPNGAIKRFNPAVIHNSTRGRVIVLKARANP